jgi:hypothetical protein
MALQRGRDYMEAMRSYKKDEGLLRAVRESLLEDKALDFVYDKAVVTLIPLDRDDEGEIPSPPADTAEKNAPAEENAEKTPGDAPAGEDAG